VNLQDLALTAKTTLSFLNKIKPRPSFDRIETLQMLSASLSRLPFDNPAQGVAGWMSLNEQRALYALARYSQGPMLEIGPWLGLSTICIAKGILDSGMNKKFVTSELAPTLRNFRPAENDSIGFFYPEHSQLPMGVCSLEIFERDIKPVLEHPHGLLGQLRSNLTTKNVSEIVEIFVGDFRDLPESKYRLVFTDSMHDENEINRNGPDLKRFVGAHSILACHDSTPTNEKCLRNWFDFSYSFTVDSLFVGEIAAC
jgi:methyltransferase family protein